MWLVVLLGIIISVIIVLTLINSMDKQMLKEQEEHPKTKPSLRERIPGWVFTVAFLLAMYLFFTRGLGFIVDQYNVREGKEEAKIQQIEDDYEALNEDNFDEASGKTILTQKFLEKEYKLFYLETEKEDGWMLKIGVIALFLICGYGILAAAQNFFGSLFKKYRSTVKAIIYLLIPAALLIVGVYAFQKINTREMPPSPKDVSSFEVFAVTARKREDVYESDGDEETRRYVYIDFGDGNGEVTYRKNKIRHLFQTIDEPGRYYLARAKSSGKDCDFMCFPEGEYIAEEE